MSEELLCVNLMKTTTSRNKIFNFKFEKEGTKLYFKSQDNGSYLLSKNKISDDLVTVKLNLYPVYKYICLYRYVKQDGYFAVLKHGDEYVLRPASQEEIDKYARKLTRTSGCYKRIQGKNVIRLTTEASSNIFRTGYVKIHVVSDSRLYVEASAIEASEAEQFPNMASAAKPYGGVSCLDKATDYTYVLNKNGRNEKYRMLPLPISFFRKCGIEYGDSLHTWFRDDKTMIIEGNPVHCRICGRPINRYFGDAKSVYICDECNSVVPDSRKLIYRGHEEGFDKISKDLAEIRELLEGFLS